METQDNTVHDPMYECTACALVATYFSMVGQLARGPCVPKATNAFMPSVVNVNGHRMTPIANSNAYGCDYCPLAEVHSRVVDPNWNPSPCSVGATATAATNVGAAAAANVAFKSLYKLWSSMPVGPDPATFPPSAAYVAEAKKPRDRCVDCKRELCAELDAYYGHDPYLAYVCAPCRKARVNTPPEPSFGDDYV